MKKHFLLTTAIMASCLMLSCSTTTAPSGDTGSDEPGDVVYMLPKTSPITLTAAQKEFARDNNSFTLSFLKTLNESGLGGKSFVCSPLSITYVLAMVNDAAEGTTEQEIEQTLGFHAGGIQAVNEYCKKLIDNLPKVDENVQLSIANAIFVNRNYRLKSQFQDDMQTYFGAKAESLDFSSGSTLGYINGWCSEKTHGMIPSILDQIAPSAVSYLLNAIYFKANWASKFDASRTKTEDFTTPSGTRQIPLMHQKVMTQYVKTDDYAAVTLPYGSGLWNMTVLLPDEGKTTDDVIGRLAADGWSTDYRTNPLLASGAAEVDLKLPRFDTSTDTSDAPGGLVSMLQKMGIREAFSPWCTEIVNMCDVPLYIFMMRQKARIEVNEEGSRMAAVTVAGMEAAMAPPSEDKADFHANRPFVYLIREASSGVILFVGKFTGE